MSSISLLKAPPSKRPARFAEEPPPSDTLWPRAHTPAVRETVRVMTAGDALGVVVALDPVRKRALLSVPDEGPGYRWEWFSMLRRYERPVIRVVGARHGQRRPLTLAGFLDDCDLRASSWTESNALRMAYQTWCEERGLVALSWEGLKNGLRDRGLCPEMRWVGPEGRKVKRRGWRGVAVRPVYIKEAA